MSAFAQRMPSSSAYINKITTEALNAIYDTSTLDKKLDLPSNSKIKNIELNTMFFCKKLLSKELTKIGIDSKEMPGIY